MTGKGMVSTEKWTLSYYESEKWERADLDVSVQLKVLKAASQLWSPMQDM